MTTNPALAQALTERDYNNPTPVQLAVLAPEATGRDLLVSAQTGSGKTVAYGLAMAETLLGSDERLPHATAPLALVVAPTRELALQVQREFAWLYARAGAITEAEDAGADLDEIRGAIGHTQASTTARYSRGAVGKSRKVAELRQAHRASRNES